MELCPSASHICIFLISIHALDCRFLPLVVKDNVYVCACIIVPDGQVVRMGILGA